VEWGPTSVHERIMAAVEREPLRSAELAKALGHQSVSGALYRAIDDLRKAKLVSFTVPEKPGSRLQRHRAVRKRDRVRNAG